MAKKVDLNDMLHDAVREEYQEALKGLPRKLEEIDQLRLDLDEVKRNGCPRCIEHEGKHGLVAWILVIGLPAAFTVIAAITAIFAWKEAARAVSGG